MNDSRFTTELDSHGRLLRDREVWRQATTLAAAGELTARWLEGNSRYQAGTFSPQMDEETRSIAAELAELNRSGFFTKESQPGLLLDTGQAQRQYVTGFCSPEAARRLLQLSTQTELIAVVHSPGEMSRSSIPVTVIGGEVVTVLGTSESPIEAGQIRDWAEESNDALALLLAESWYVELFDPVWGRNDQLLPAVLETVKETTGSF